MHAGAIVLKIASESRVWPPIRRGALAAALAGACLISSLIDSPLQAAERAASPAAAGLDFQREIQPLLAEHCAHCHGIDESTRQGGLRQIGRAHV